MKWTWIISAGLLLSCLSPSRQQNTTTAPVASIVKQLFICYDDINWLDPTDLSQRFELTCSYDTVTRISVLESFLYFSAKVDPNNWINTLSVSRIDCLQESRDWVGQRFNYTFTIQQECNRNSAKYPQQGLRCAIPKHFLRSTLFKLNRQVLDSLPHLYPYPYSLMISYQCI